jgi:hypothetical protein
MCGAQAVEPLTGFAGIARWRRGAASVNLDDGSFYTGHAVILSALPDIEARPTRGFSPPRLADSHPLDPPVFGTQLWTGASNP